MTAKKKSGEKGVKPAQDKPKTFSASDIKKIQKLAEKENLPELTYKQREEIYRKHLEEKYG